MFRLDWDEYEDVDPLESNWLPEFNRPPDEAFALMSDETNRYAEQYLDTSADFY